MRYSKERSLPITLSSDRDTMRAVAENEIAALEEAQVIEALHGTPDAIRGIVEAETRAKLAKVREDAKAKRGPIVREMQTLERKAVEAAAAIPAAEAKLAKAREKAAAVLDAPATEYNNATIAARTAGHQLTQFCNTNIRELLPDVERNGLRRLIERLADQLRADALNNSDNVGKIGAKAALDELFRVQDEAGRFLNSGELPPADLTGWIADALARIGEAREHAEARERQRLMFEHNLAKKAS